ncbi:MAG: FAD-binding oxidoreductase [Chloroflexia bacterium]|nr:FAD-binding oxidoreductase [Chloroflexia bacterium]
MEPLTVREADVVVIGAGAFGCATAYHLATQGAGRVVLLDKGEPGDGSSARAAGLFKLVQADETLTRLSRRSAEIVAGFASATGVPLPVRRSGSILAARTPAHAALIRAELAQSRAWGIELEPVDDAAVRRLAPYLDPTGFKVALHVPGDIFVEEPTTLLAAFLTAGSGRGVTVEANAPAIAVRSTRGRVTGVVTPRGEIACETVVAAAGAWATLVGAQAGVAVPVASVRHELAITDPIAGIAPDLPIARIIDASAYLRPARGGLMVGGFEPDPLPFAPPPDPSWTISDLALDPAVPARMAAGVQANAPLLGGAPYAEVRGGLFTMTPDARFLAGPVPGLDGFWLNTGCNGSGFSFAAAIGEALAAWITTGAPPLDLSSLAPARFGDRSFTDAELVELGIWQYANYYTPPDVAAKSGGGLNAKPMGVPV